MGEVPCGWAGCGSNPEATLDGLPLCRSHFYDTATNRLEKYRARLQPVELAGADRGAILKFLSDVVSQTTSLVLVARFLGPSQRDQFLELSLSAMELYKRVQRNPRILRQMPILIYRETESVGGRELTNTVKRQQTRSLHQNEWCLANWRESLDGKAGKPTANACASRLAEKERTVQLSYWARNSRL